MPIRSRRSSPCRRGRSLFSPPRRTRLGNLRWAFRAQADALEIEALAKRRLADEYDAAQGRGEDATRGKPVNVPGQNIKATANDIGASITKVDFYQGSTLLASVGSSRGMTTVRPSGDSRPPA